MRIVPRPFRKPASLAGHTLLRCLFCCLAILCLAPAPPAGAEGVDATYRVMFVAQDDTLNIRSAPGASNTVVGMLPPDAQGLRITGVKQMVGRTAWYPIAYAELRGWVSGRFLAREIPPEVFCRVGGAEILEQLDQSFQLKNGASFTSLLDKEGRPQILAQLERAIGERNGALLASLVDPDRGLRLYLDPWGKGMTLGADELGSIFTSPVKGTWGVDSEVQPVDPGTFTEVVLPLLERDVLHPTRVACNEMQRPEPSPPGMVPMGAEGINFYSYFRSPRPDENELDWSEWYVGIEEWDGRLVVSFLAHFHWTP